MANQISVSSSTNSITVTENTIQVQISRAVVGNISNIANANYANYANVANVANSVTVGNVAGIGNIATINLDGNALNLLHGDGSWAPASGNISANYSAYAGNVTIANQPNITNVGTLTTLAVSGNITVGNANLGNLAVANYFSGDGNGLANIQAANVVGNLPVRFEVKNTSAGTLAKGTPVYITGSVGASGVVEVQASRADTSSTMGCVGLLEQSLTTGSLGTAISVGSLSGMNTNSYTIGQQLYVGATGGITNVRPNDGYIVQSIGVVSRVNASTGFIEVNIWNINGLPNLNNGNIWVGNSSNGYPVQQVLATANVGNAGYSVSSGTAAVANSVSLANVSGAGNIASINLTGSSSNVLYGNGVFAAVSATNANYANFAGEAFSVSGSNVSGAVGLATYATTANAVALANVSGAGNIASINLTGSSSNVLYGNGVFADISVTSVANANYANFAGEAFNVSGSNVSGAVGLATYATTANAVAGANVSGEVSFAATANSVALANVSGIGNIASINIDGSASNVLYGNGAFAAISITSVANANYANFAGEAFSVTGSNVSGEVSFAATANAVALANVSGAGNIASINLDGSGSNVLYGNGTWAPAGGASYNQDLNTYNDVEFANLRVANGNVRVNSIIAANTQQIVLTSAYNGEGSGAGGTVTIGSDGSGENLVSLVAGNVKIQGLLYPATDGTTGQVLSTDGAGNLSWASGGSGGSSISNGTSNVSIPTTDGNIEFYVNGSYAATVGPGVSGAGSIQAQIFQHGNTQMYINANAGIYWYVAGITNTMTLENSGSANTAVLTLDGTIVANNTPLLKFNETTQSGGTVSGTLSPDVATGTIFNYTINGGITINDLTNAVAGTSATIIITQGGSGSYTLTSSMKFAGGDKTLSTAVGAIDIISVFYDGSTYYAVLSKGFA